MQHGPAAAIEADIGHAHGRSVWGRVQGGSLGDGTDGRRTDG
jgi:hypothetical protein